MFLESAENCSGSFWKEVLHACYPDVTLQASPGVFVCAYVCACLSVHVHRVCEFQRFTKSLVHRHNSYRHRAQCTCGLWVKFVLFSMPGFFDTLAQHDHHIGRPSTNYGALLWRIRWETDGVLAADGGLQHSLPADR